MGISINHQTSRYYDYYRDQEIVFTKANIQILRLDPRQVYVKCNGGQWPCIINSSSLESATIIIGNSSGVYKEIEKTPSIGLSIRYCFLDQSNNPIHFFVNCSVVKKESYHNTAELSIVTLNFSQRPPDDLIERLGEFIETNENFKNRKEDRIEINENSMRKLGLAKEETLVAVEGIPRRSIVKDLSFGGAKVLLAGIPKFLIKRKVSLQLEFVDTGDIVSIQGIIARSEFLEGRQDIAVVHIQYVPETVPMAYKTHINNFITNFQKSILNNKKHFDNKSN